MPRHDVNHRQHRNNERIKEYVRMLEMGTNPPPIKVHRATNILVNGLHRFYAAKQHAYDIGQKWQEYLIEVEWTDDMPNPDSDPLLFAVSSAAENRYNGEPLDRTDVLRLVGDVLKKYGKEKARECALAMNETNKSFEEYYRQVCPSPPPTPITTRQVGETPEGEPQFATGEWKEDPIPSLDKLLAPVIRRHPDERQLGDLRSARPPILKACQMLKESLKELKRMVPVTSLTQREEDELEDVYRLITEVLDKY